MKNINDSLIAFEEYKNQHRKYIEADLSESDTRSKLIDSAIIDVLGWDEGDIDREGHVESGYYDYRVSIPGINFIVEAKRQFKELVLPSHHDKTTIKVLLKENEEIITQVRKYALDEGVPYAVVTNGYQFIVLKLINVNGKPWKDNVALLFKSIDDINDRFIEFYNNLSKNSVIKNGGFIFDLPFKSIEAKTVLSTLVDRDKELIRNSLSAVLAPLVDQVFGEMFTPEREDNIQFIRECFVENAETKKNQNEIERLFHDRAPQVGNVIPIVNTANLAESIVGEINQDEITIRNNYPPKPIIIIGSKGAGKTTFINHLFKHRFDEEKFVNQFIIYIDFRKFFEVQDSFQPERIAREILELIYSNYEELDLHKLNTLIRIYRTQIKRNDENIWKWDKEHSEASYQNKLSTFFDDAQKDTLEHLKYLSHYLIRERRRRLIVIIDNADQYDDLIQEKLFVFSHSLTKSTLCGTVISLREGYFRKWQNSPPFDAYESNIYHITAPRYFEVLQRRIQYAIEKVKNDQVSYSIRITSDQTASLSPSYIEFFLKSLQDSIITISESALLEFVNQTTFPNIREGLRVFKIFLNSGHTKVSEYIRREKTRAEWERVRQIIPFHEFIKSIALQNRHYYSSDVSVVYNIFIPPADSDDHFIKLYILSDLSEILENIGFTDSFVKSTVIIDKLTDFGYRINVINSAISNLLKAALIDTDEQISDIEWNYLPPAYNLGITSKGFYYLKELTSRFHYYDLIAQDTPIYDSRYFSEMCATFPNSSAEGVRNFEFRKDFVKVFLKYLQEREDRQSSQVRLSYSGLFRQLDKKVQEEMNRIDHKVDN